MCEKFDIIAFDADDTLWHNEVFYRQGRDIFSNLLSQYVDNDLAGNTLDQIETSNVQFYGYGIKSFILSMIETALQLTDRQVDSSIIMEIIDYAKKVLVADPQHFSNAQDTLENLAKKYDLMMITKGDLFEQRRKVASSGLGHFFRYIEVVSDKEPETYIELLKKYGIKPESFLMIGNSLRSDILPVVEIGGQAVHIPYELTWDHEKILQRPLEQNEYHELEDIGQVPALIQQLCQD